MKRFYLCLVLSGLVFNSAISQNSTLDSLIQLLPSLPVDTSRVNLLNEISYEFMDEDFDQATKFGQEAFEAAQDLDYHYGAVRALATTSYSFMQIGQVNRSLELAEKALEIALEHGNDKMLSMAYGTLGNAYSEQGQIQKSLEAYQKALTLDEKIGKPTNHCYTLHNIAVLLEETGDFEGSFKYYKAALDVALASQNEQLIGEAHNSIGYGYLNKEAYDSAAYYFSESLNLARKYNDQWMIGIGLTALADAESGRGNFELSNKLLSESIEIQSKIKDFLGISHAYQSIADNLAKQGRHQESIEKNLKALDYMEHSHSLIGQPEVNKKIAESYAEIGNMNQAYRYLNASQQLSDSLYSNEKKQQLLELEAKYHGEQNEVKNKVLLAQQAEQEAVIHLQYIISIASIITLCLVGIICLAVFRNYKQNKRLNVFLEEKVNERTAALENRNNELKSTIEELERFNHIASHDIKEPIRVVGSMAGLIRRRLPTEIREKMEQDFDTIISGTRQLYTLMEDISAMSRQKKEPVKLAKFDVDKMAATVVQLLRERIQSSNAVVELQYLPTIVSSESLFTIIFKNLIENGIKYNQSLIPRVLVKYRKMETHHVFTFKDNGMGIKKDYQMKIFDMFSRLHRRDISGSGIGLYNVKIAVEKLNGRIKVKSEEGSGSEFIIYLPALMHAQKSMTTETVHEE